MDQMQHGSARTTGAVVRVIQRSQENLRPLDHCIGALLSTIPPLTRSSRHPWTNGQVKRMSRMINEANVRRYHYDSHHQLAAHLSLFITGYNFGR
jgi:hypothetical protein